MNQYLSYLPLIEILENDNFKEHIIYIDIIYFNLYIKDNIIAVLEDKLISYIYDDEKQMIIFYSLNHLMKNINQFIKLDHLEIEHIYNKIKPLFNNCNIDLFDQDDYCFEHKTVLFKYLIHRQNMLWSFNDNCSYETEYKMWFNCESLFINDNYYLSLLNITSQFVIMNNKSKNIKWNQLKFFFNGPPYNIIIYLNKDEPYENLILDDIIQIFEARSVYKFCVKVGYSAIGHSPTIYTYKIGYNDLNY